MTSFRLILYYSASANDTTASNTGSSGGFKPAATTNSGNRPIILGLLH